MHTLEVPFGTDGSTTQAAARRTKRATPMPFQSQNRMTTTLLLAVLLLCGIGVGGAVAVARSGNAGSTPVSYAVFAFVVIALKMVLAMLQTENARRQILNDLGKTSKDIRGEVQAATRTVEAAAKAVEEVVEKTDGHLEKAIHTAGEEIRAAEREQLIPSTHAEIEDLVNRACKKTAQVAADAAVRQYVESQQRAAGGGE